MDDQGAQAQTASTSTSPSQHLPSIYSELLQLRRTFSDLRDVAKPATLHLLDHQTVQALAPSPAPSSSLCLGTAPFGRTAFADKISSVRRAAQAWRKKAVDLRDASLVEPSSSSSFDRYISLNKEKAQNVAQLESNLQPLRELEKRLAGAQTGEDALYGVMTRQLPAVLHAGALGSSGSTSLTGTKRKRKAGESDSGISTSHLPSHSRGEAVKVLACLAAALEELARALGLETFAEAFTDSLAAGDLKETSSLHTHTLTQGGKLIVLDVELGLEASREKSESIFQPATRVKLSFTNRTNVSYTSPMKEGEESVDGNTRIADLLRRDVEALARLLFGLPVAGEEVVGNTEMSLEEASLILAKSHFNRYRTNLLRLLKLDRLSSVKASESGDQQGAAAIAPCDTFAALHQVSRSLEEASSNEVSKISSLSKERNGVARIGHGLPLLHTGLVGVYIVFDNKGGSSANIKKAVEGRGLHPIHGLPKDSQLYLLDVIIEPQNVVLSAGSAGIESSSTSKASLDSIPELGSGIAFVAKLTPPVLLPRRLVSRVAKIGGLPAEETLALHSTHPAAQGPSGAGDYGSILGLGSSSKFKKGADVRVRYQPKRSKSTAEENALLVSSIPFKSLEQLYMVIEVLQEASAVQRLLEGLVSITGAPEQDSAKVGSNSRSLTAERAAASIFDVSLTDVTTSRSGEPTVGAEPLRFAVRLSARISDPQTGRFYVLSCYIHRDARCRSGYGVSGGLTDTLALMGGAASSADGSGAGQSGQSDLPEDLKSAVGEVLAEEADLRRAADLLLQWAWDTIDGSQGGKQTALSAGMTAAADPGKAASTTDFNTMDLDKQDEQAPLPTSTATGTNTPLTRTGAGEAPAPAPPAPRRRHSSRSSPLSPRTSPRSTRHAEAAAPSIGTEDDTAASSSADTGATENGGFAGILRPSGVDSAAAAPAGGSSELPPISTSSTTPTTGSASASAPGAATRTTRRRSSRGPSTPSPTRGMSIVASHHQTRRRSSQQRASGSGSGSASGSAGASASASEAAGVRGRRESGETEAGSSASGVGGGGVRMTRRASALASAGETGEGLPEGVGGAPEEEEM